jgi:hypothetical protein
MLNEGQSMAGEWTFGLTQLLSVVGLGLGGLGLRTLNKWRRERIEEKNIDVAMDALSLAYESNGVFEHIRARLSNSSEWEDMETIPGESERERIRRGSYYAILKRIQLHRPFFERAWAMQPKCMVLFGHEAEEIFSQLQKARRAIEVACKMLTHDIKRPEDDETLWFQLRADIWGGDSHAKEPHRVDNMLEDFRSGIERLCRPTLTRPRSFFDLLPERFWPLGKPPK